VEGKGEGGMGGEVKRVRVYEGGRGRGGRGGVGGGKRRGDV